MPYSPAASGMRCSRRSSLRAWSSTSLGMCALAIAFSSSAISADFPSSASPSWRWMAAICSRSRTSRLREFSEALVSRPISCESRRTSIRCASSRDTRSIRAPMSTVSRISCFSSGVASRTSPPDRRARPAIDALDGRQRFVGRLRQELDRLDRLTLEIARNGPRFRWTSGRARGSSLSSRRKTATR